MDEQMEINYNRIAKAIDYINKHFKEQPTLDQIAEEVHLSPFHFQRMFTDWAGTSPKKFLQYISVEHAKALLKESRATLFDVAYETGLSGTSRLHDLFVNIEGMTPAEYKNGGKNLSVNYSFADSPFGKLLIASTPKGVCYMAFTDNYTEGIEIMQSHFPQARFFCQSDAHQQNALSIFGNDWQKMNQIKLHLKGTDFQLKVWETLLRIPMGQLSTYGSIAQQLETPRASRAVGSAIGSNPVAYLIPCHRVIQSTGIIGGYMWGNVRKTAIIGWEGGKMASAR